MKQQAAGSKRQIARVGAIRERVLAAALVIALPLFLLLGNLYLFVSPVFLRHEYGKQNLPPALSFDDEERLAIAQTASLYLRSGADLEALAALEVFNDRELAHLADVKRVMRGAFTIHTFSALTVAAALVLLVVRPKGFWKPFGSEGGQRTFVVSARHLKRVCFYIFLACALLAGALLATALVVYLNFEWFFIAFHHLFFEGDSWLFSTTDTLIQLFPPQFWIDASLEYAFLTLAEAALIGGMALALALVLRGRQSAAGG